MEPEEQKVCPNCKREIPAVNFTIHTVHCARNIRVCPVCKEPVPQAELEEHHEKLHKLLPCKQCGEKVCGTDLEDHIRDSCGHTIKSCRYCELELPRRELPSHEGYCGARTEQCAECGEWVMIKYRQLHVDSNHGFLRLDDDPVPQPKREPLKPANFPKVPNLPKPTNEAQPSTSTSNGFHPAPTFIKNTNILQDRPRTEIRHLGSSNNGPSTSNVHNGLDNFSSNITRPLSPRNETRYLGSSNNGPSTSNIQNGLDNFSSNVSKPLNIQNMPNGISKVPKRTNDKPQINTNVMAADKVNKEPISRGAVKKRPAPKPPTREPPTRDPKREMAYQSALQRSQQEEKRRQEQNAYNLAHGLPPVLSPAAKLEKLRKMDALHNRELEPTDYKNRLQGRVWMDHLNVPVGNVLGSDSSSQGNALEADRRRSPDQDHRSAFRDVKPMTPNEFLHRFNELQLRKDATEIDHTRDDRFSQIKSSLRELRRGLNEVTAPYNIPNLNACSNGMCSGTRRRSPGRAEPEDVELPCEFCGAPVPSSQLVQHQTGCRPDLTQYRPRSASPQPPPRAAYDVPVIPCEFCTESLPVYLISEHQERCGRESNRLYPD